MAYFAIDRKQDQGLWRFAGFIEARTRCEAQEQLEGITDKYRIIGDPLFRNCKNGMLG